MEGSGRTFEGKDVICLGWDDSLGSAVKTNQYQSSPCTMLVGDWGARLGNQHETAFHAFH